MDYAVEVENLSKRYVIGEKERYLVLSEFLVKLAKAPFNLLRGRGFRKKNQFMALNDVNFKIKKGEVVGIIGRNGAGKSTLLKVLSRITEPTSGIVKMRGRVSSLLEVGTGFHPELTGRENIYLNGAILGMSKKEIDRKFDEIVEFSGVEKFLDMPVKRYSSGMQVRLAFSVAAHLEPDILIIDEVLAVGDAEFQKKCLGKMDEVTKDGGRTVIFVSHDMGAIKRICNNLIVMREGSIAYQGDVDKGIEMYLKTDITDKPVVEFKEEAKEDAKLILKKAYLTGESNEPELHFPYGGEINLNIQYELRSQLKGWLISFELYNVEGTCVLTSTSRDYEGHLSHSSEPGLYSYSIPIDSKLFTRPGSYFIKVSSTIPKVEFLHTPNETIYFEITDGQKTPSYKLAHGRKGVIEPVLHWELNKLS
ncbi:MAG TPA: ABC transporter ATP-binding protein [Candidatus Dojkabacteria bacterium]|nr:ABC transporter ATP-binding protein [Candidatus Dojkabacteria bacterium]